MKEVLDSPQTQNLAHRYYSTDSAKTFTLVNPTISKDDGFYDSLNLWVAVFTFVLGFIVNGIINLARSKKELRRYFKRWQLELKAVASPLAAQIQALNEFLEAQRPEVYEIPNPPLNTLLKFSSFHALDKGKLFDAVKMRLKGKRKEKSAHAMKVCNDVISYVDSLAIVDEMYLKKLDEFMSRTGVLFEKFNENYRQVTYSYRNLGIEIEAKLGDVKKSTPFIDLSNLMNLYFGGVSESVTDIFILESSLFKAIDLISGQLRQFDNCKQLHEFNHGCITNIQQIREERRVFNFHVSATIRKFQNLLEELDTTSTLN